MKDESKTSSIRILLVEDNLDHALVVKRIIQNHTIEIDLTHVQDGEEALNFLFHQNDNDEDDQFQMPNIILLDWRLPKINGLEVLKKIKTSLELKKIPVIILTTSEANIDYTNAYEHNANSYLVKPMDFGEFSEMMDKFINYWVKWNYDPWVGNLN